jgi:hypothetical protein
VKSGTGKITSAALLAIPLAATMLVAACGGDTKPNASASNKTSSSGTTAAASTSPTAAVIRTTDPNIPAAARAHTTAGAEVFVGYFFKQLNRSWSTADPSLLPPLSKPVCKTCGAYTASAASLRSKNQHYRGEAMSVSYIGGQGSGLKGEEVLVVAEQKPGAVVDAKGKVIQATVRQTGKLVVSLAWTGSVWTAVEVQGQK